jgi:hypothetical protein
MEEHVTDRSPYSKPGFVASAVLLGMLVLAALFVVIGAASRHHAAPVTASRNDAKVSATAPKTPAAKTVSAGSCSLPVGAQTVPTVSPITRWVSVGQMSAPQAPRTYGPQRTDDGFAVCFAHNPTGSLLAAVNFFAQATVASPVTLLQKLAANTPTRAAAIAQARDGGSDQLLQQSDGDPGTVQVTGFEFVDYTPAEANVNVVLEGPGGEYAAVECQLVWQNEDWKFVIPMGGQLDSSQLTSMDGFVSWTADSWQISTSTSAGGGS